jgi:hypothetical protein
MFSPEPQKSEETVFRQNTERRNDQSARRRG